MTLDCGQAYVRFDEKFKCRSTDQIVWDFKGKELPCEIRLLDPGERYHPLSVHYHIDHRMARLFSWTQYSQLFDLSDGFGLVFPEGDEVGFVALEGGRWEGGRLNHLELWARRWRESDPTTRRGLPPEAKADSFPCPDEIPARGRGVCEPHLNLEGWLGEGRRIFALAFADHANDRTVSGRQSGPFDPPPPILGHFETMFDRKSLEDRQYFLRRLHIQRGMMPLQEMLEMSFEWPADMGRGSSFKWPHPIFEEHHCECSGDLRKDAESMMDYLNARVYGFWEGSGAAYTNCVCGRRIAPEMFRFEHLASIDGVMTEEEKNLCRAHFAFLSYLYASDNYYPGIPPMTPPASQSSFEPTIAGMSNQNFYTDIINVFGTATQIFHEHPMASAWRDKFAAMLDRQLEYHMYPESGVWEESHTYYQHVLVTLFPLLARRKADSVDDYFSNPLFQKLAGYVLKIAVPRNRHFDGVRHVAPLGDHDSDPHHYRNMYVDYAAAFKDSAPELSSQLAWLYSEMGGNRKKILPREISVPEWKSEHVKGLGYFFRNHDENGEEELLILRCGPVWGHHHADDGSIQFYAKGRTWITDAAFGCPAERGSDKFEAEGHSRWRPKRLVAPLNWLWRFNRGWISSYDIKSDMEWAVAYSPIFMDHPSPVEFIPLKGGIEHCRAVVRLASCTYLIVDGVPFPEHNILRYHVPGGMGNIKADGSLVQLVTDGYVFDIAALSVQAPVVSLSMSIPANPKMKEKFTTTGIEFDCGAGRLAVTVLSLRKSGPPMQIERKSSEIKIRTFAGAWAVAIPDLSSIIVSRNVDGKECVIPFIEDHLQKDRK
jgi:hypothetical protein